MSDSYLCTDTHLDRPVVVKALKPGTEEKRILDELAALQAIRSKHVVQVYDVVRGPKGEIEAIIEEYLPGKDLMEAPKVTAPEEFLKLAYPIAKGIADIHAHGRVHRDIKPNNMKYDGEGCLKIFDFGLARTIGVDDLTKGLIGTPGFMAPELFLASKSGTVKFTEAVDTYAFGVTTLSLVLPKLPSDLRKLPPVLPCAQADFSALPFSLPDEIVDALNQCLAKEPEGRPEMKDVANLLSLHLLRDRHRALLVHRGKTYVIDKQNPIVNLSVPGQGSLRIEYDGLRFVVKQVQGNVAINNMLVTNGYALPGSCVIVLGASELKAARTNITVDVSHPEVAL